MRQSKKYPLLNDIAWLKQKYEVDKLSTIQIGSLVGGANCGQVTRRLAIFGIQVRTKSEGHTCNREGDGFRLNESVVTGCLLGDGDFYANNRDSDGSYPIFRKNNIYYDHIVYVAKMLFDKWEERISEGKNDGGFGKGTIFSLRSLTHQELMPWFRKWYPPKNNFVKIIPENIKIDEKVLLHWFLDDGYSCRRKNRCGKVYAGFASMCFQRDEQEMLVEKIQKKFGIRMKVSYHQRNGEVKGTGWEIIVPQSQTQQFFEIIGPPPVSSLAYKWKFGHGFL